MNRRSLVVLVLLVAVATTVTAASGPCQRAAMTSDALVQRLEAGRPFFFAYGTNGVRRLREQVADDSVLSANWKALKARCDESLAKSARVPSRGAEWPSWYTCRKCATWLKEREKGVHVCPACGEEHRGVVYDDVVLYGVHQGLQREIRELGYAYLVSGEARYAERAKELLLAYARVIDTPGYRLHDTKGKASVYGGNVFAEMLVDAWWLVDVVAGYDSVAETMSADERRLVEERIVRKIADHAYRHDLPQNEAVGNHEMWHVAAYGLAGMLLRDPKLIDRARARMNYQLRCGTDQDGCWFEGAFDYHFFTMLAAIGFLQALENVGVDVGSEFPATYWKMFEYPLDLVGPDRVLPALNDDAPFLFSRENVNKKQRFVVDLYDRTRRWTKTPAIDRPTPDKSKLLAASGLAMLREGPNAVLFKFGPHGGWHGHYDKLSFVLWVNGECISEDVGCCGYGNPKHFGWYKNTLSHNAVSADGVRQEPATGKLLAFRSERGWSGVAADAGEAIRDAKVRRAIVLAGSVVLDFVIAEAEAPREWEWAFHAKGVLETDWKGVALPLPPPSRPREGVRPGVTDGKESWNWTRNVLTGRHDALWRAKWTSSRSTLRLSQRTSAAGSVRSAEVDGLIGEKGPNPLTLVASRVRGRRALFATAMTIDGTEAEVLSVGDTGFAVRIGKKSYRLDFDGANLELRNKMIVESGK